VRVFFTPIPLSEHTSIGAESKSHERCRACCRLDCLRSPFMVSFVFFCRQFGYKFTIMICLAVCSFSVSAQALDVEPGYNGMSNASNCLTTITILDSYQPIWQVLGVLWLLTACVNYYTLGVEPSLSSHRACACAVYKLFRSSRDIGIFKIPQELYVRVRYIFDFFSSRRGASS